LLLGTPLAIPLGVAENIFHFALSLPALAILLLHTAGWSRRSRRADGRRASA
jgi:hypothetical protein